MKKQKMQYKLVVRLFTEDQNKAFGPGIAELLRRVDSFHSLRSAAASMEMAYSKAWTIIRNSESYFGFKLLSTATGGKGGGGAVLTDEGRDLLQRYDSFYTELQEYGKKLFAEKFEDFNSLSYFHLHP